MGRYAALWLGWVGVQGNGMAWTDGLDGWRDGGGRANVVSEQNRPLVVRAQQQQEQEQEQEQAASRRLDGRNQQQQPLDEHARGTKGLAGWQAGRLAGSTRF